MKNRKVSNLTSERNFFVSIFHELSAETRNEAIKTSMSVYLVGANVGEVSEILDRRSDVRTTLELIGDGGIGGEGGRKRRRVAGDEVERLSADGDEIGGIEVSDGGDVGRETNAGVAEGVEKCFLRRIRH